MNYYLFKLLPVILLALGVPVMAQAQAPCQLPAGLQPISLCRDNSGDVVVGPSAGVACTRVFFDRSLTGAAAFKNLTIEAGGEVYIGDESVAIDVETIDVSGLLQVGSRTCPVGTQDPKHHVVFNFLGERPCSSPDKCDGFFKGLRVNTGGLLRLYGLKGAPSPDRAPGSFSGTTWTHLSAPAGPEDKYGPDSGARVPVPDGGARILQLAVDVTQGPGAWQKGDWIAVATTGFSAVETEIVQITHLSSRGENGSTVQIAQALQHYHFGGPDPGAPSLETFNDCSGFNFGVDERAEVALLSRNIKLTATIAPGDNNLHWGGELMFRQDFGEVSVQGVEIEKFGKDQLGAYPIHFHQAGDVSTQNPLVNGNSIHHSYNKCVTVHSTGHVTVENNACVRIVGHIFYQEIGDEVGIRYLNNLGLGAMAHHFDVMADTPAERDQKIKDFWWAGDHLGQKASPTYNGYDGFNLPNTDAQDNPVRGVCATPDPAGRGLVLKSNPFTIVHPGPCSGEEIYFEPTSGFWIIHPGTDLIGNSIGGCQDVGRGYWYVPPRNAPSEGVPAELTQLALHPLGTFKNNRVHSCYSGLYGESEFGVFSEQLFPRSDGTNTGKNVIGLFDGITSTRNRDRGLWMRPVWFVVKNGRFATNRNSVTLVSSGGLDGNAPGMWALLEDSVVVGVSQNNVDRWGPCPRNIPETYDCVNPDRPSISAPNAAKGFPTPSFNLSGYMIYDGPILIFRDRFVNFNRDITPHLTHADRDFLESFSSFPNANFPAVYEGDAALGWFQNNQSAYPTGTESRDLSFDNVDLRHQIYTEKVNLGDFQDGDKNTAIIDVDGSLTGFRVVDANGDPVPGAHPISLNNLEFNHASNSVDECLAEGEQDEIAEGRPTSLISAGSYATLEFQALLPPLPVDSAKQTMTFVKDQQEFDEHPEMALTSRNGLGVWEPKVASGYGYTVGASTCDRKPLCSDDAGIPPRVSVGLTDAIKPVISADDPFYVRVGICFTNKDGTHPADAFTIRRGYRSWGGNGTNTQDKDLQQFFNALQNRYMGQSCHNLDFQVNANLDPVTGCPADGVTPPPPTAPCPPPSVADTDQQGNPACVYPTSMLTAAAGIDELTLPDGSPDLSKYYYDASAGLLFFYVAQELPNAFGPSPLGSCTSNEADDPNCPDLAAGESYYACPAAGCSDYVVELNDGAYNPGPSNCTPYPTYAGAFPADELLLAHRDSGEIVMPMDRGGKNNLFPHREATVPPQCPHTVVFGETNDTQVLVVAQTADTEALPGPPRCPPALTADNGGCSLHPDAARPRSDLVWFILLLGLAALMLRRRLSCEI